MSHGHLLQCFSKNFFETTIAARCSTSLNAFHYTHCFKVSCCEALYYLVCYRLIARTAMTTTAVAAMAATPNMVIELERVGCG